MPLVSAELISLVYDANGNLISGDGKFRVYDEWNRQVEVRNGSDSSGALLEVSVWHPVQERILFKDVYEGGVRVRTTYYFNGFTQDENVTDVFNTTEVYQDGTLVAENTPQGKRFISSDPLGSSSLTTDQYGTPIENTTYDSYGNILSGGSGRFDYEDKEFSSLTGEYDFQFRKYNPSLKIFTQPDTIIQNSFDPQALNRYMFERGNPYKNNDPTGHYNEEFHREVTYDAAIEVGFSEGDAAKIANANMAMDLNPETSPLNPLNFVDGGATDKYHFASRDEAEKRVLAAIDSGDIEALGQALHTYQDTYAHEGSTKWNHWYKTLAGRKYDPDNPLVNFRNAVSMYSNTKEFLATALDLLQGKGISSKTTGSSTSSQNKGTGQGSILLSSDYKEIRPGVFSRTYYNDKGKLTQNVKYTK